MYNRVHWLLFFWKNLEYLPANDAYLKYKTRLWKKTCLKPIQAPFSFKVDKKMQVGASKRFFWKNFKNGIKKRRISCWFQIWWKMETQKLWWVKMEKIEQSLNFFVDNVVKKTFFPVLSTVF